MNRVETLAPAVPAVRRSASRRNASRALVVGSVFLGGHAVLGVAVRAVPAFALLHAAATLLIGLFVAAVRPRRQVAYVLVYIAGSEALWRMARDIPVYEFGKYAVSTIIVISMLRFPPRKHRALAIAYFLVLLPSAFLTLTGLDLDRARQQISFNLSGPLSLSLCMLFFAQLKLSYDDARRLLYTLLGPVLSIAMFSVFSTISRSHIEFKNGSNAAVTGGFGPNQVAAMLGLGLLFALLLVLERKTRWRMRLPLIALSVLFAIQATLTFSRGGIAMAGCAFFVAIVYLLRDRRSRIALLVAGALLGGIGYYVVVPRLQRFTHGELAERYTNSSSSNRVKLAHFDLEIFEDHPFFGVGPGVAPDYRVALGVRADAHTEFTRLLAEHGCFGAIAIALLIWLGIRTQRRAEGIVPRALVAALLVWAALFLGIDAMRLVAPSVVAGLAIAFSHGSRAWQTQPQQ